MQQGDALYVTAPSGGFAGGSPYMVGSIFGVASFDTPQTITGVLWVKGVYTLPKTSAQAWAVGDALYWDSANSVLTNVGGGPPVAIATNPAANPSPTGNALLAPFPNGNRIARGQRVMAAAIDTVVTGLPSVASVVVSLEDDPTINCVLATGQIGNQSGAPAAGSIFIKVWKPTSTSVTTLVAATSFGQKINWIAVG